MMQGDDAPALSETDQLLAKQKAVEARALANFERDAMPVAKDDKDPLPVAAPAT
jgi:hypothetical protein